MIDTCYHCTYPACETKGGPPKFTRAADLERHYVHFHGGHQFPCAYKKCARSTKPFSRKDHYRDHLRDYHKEDVGTSKKTYADLPLTDYMGKFQINPKYWRCTKCLVNVHVANHGWQCPDCGCECGINQKKARTIEPERGADDVGFEES